MVESPTRRTATETAPIAGTSREKSPVISVTMIIIAIGAWEMAPKRAIIPTITKTGTDSTGTIPGSARCSKAPRAPPADPPITSPGAKTPPLPPEPMVSDVVRIFANGRRRSTPIGSML